MVECQKRLQQTKGLPILNQAWATGDRAESQELNFGRDGLQNNRNNIDGHKLKLRGTHHETNNQIQYLCSWAGRLADAQPDLE
jgi:hypothetical protein